MAGAPDVMTMIMAAASLLLAGGAGLLASLLVSPVRGVGRVVGLIALSGASLVAGLALLDGLPAVAALLPPLD